MALTDKDMQKAAQLAALDFNDTQMPIIKKDLQRILDFVEILKAVDTQGLQPLFSPQERMLNLRADHAEDLKNRRDYLDLAPESVGDLYKVPPVV